MVVATVLAGTSLWLALAFKQAPYRVLPSYAVRMRIWLALAIIACIAGAAVLVLGGRRVDRWIAQLGERLRNDLAAVVQRFEGTHGGDPAPILLALAAVTAVGLWLRLRYVGQPMRYDEAYTYNFYGRHPLSVSLSAYESPNNHLLNTLLIHLSTKALGNHEWTVRLPALVFGSLLPPAVYLAARMFAGAGASCLVAAAAAGWPVLIEYSVNGRGYTAVAFFFTLAVLLAALAVDDDRLLYRIGLVAATVALLYTTPAAIYATVLVWSWLLLSLWSRGRRRGDGMSIGTALRCGLASSGILAFLYAFPLLVGGFGAVLAREDIRPRAVGSYLADWGPNLAAIAGFVFRSVPASVALVVVLLAVAGVALVLRDRKSPAAVPALGLPAALAVTVVQRQWPYIRVWILLVPLVLVTAAAGLDAIGRLLPSTEAAPTRRYAPLAVGVAAVLVAVAVPLGALRSGSIAESTDTGYAPEAREATRAMAERLGPGVSVVARVPADAPLIYYFEREGLGSDYFKPRQADRFLVFVNDKGEDPLSTVESFGVRPPAGVEPTMVWEGSRSAVYELTGLAGVG